MTSMILPDMNTSLSLAEESPAGIADEEDVFDQRPIDSNVIKDYRRLFERTKLKDTKKSLEALLAAGASRGPGGPRRRHASIRGIAG